MNAQLGEEASEKKQKGKRHEWMEYDDLTTITTTTRCPSPHLGKEGNHNHHKPTHLPISSRLVSSSSQPTVITSTTASRISLRRSHHGATPSKALVAVSPDRRQSPPLSPPASRSTNSHWLVSSSFAARPSNPSVFQRCQSE